MTPAPALPKARIEAITDGIFAVSMTLLVLDLKLPEHVDQATDVWGSVLRLIPQFDDYVISFLVLCVFWLAHLRLLARMTRVDMPFVWTNLAFLLFTTFVPMLTAFAGHNPGLPRPAVLYGLNVMAILTCEMLMWRRALPRLTELDAQSALDTWHLARRRFVLAYAIVWLGMLLALLEIRLGWRSAYASYVYLLLLAAGILHPALPKRRFAWLHGKDDPR